MWQPIETAPKDGWFLLAHDIWGTVLGRHSKDTKYQWEWFYPQFADDPRLYLNAQNGHVMYWMPLPDPPKSPADGSAPSVTRSGEAQT